MRWLRSLERLSALAIVVLIVLLSGCLTSAQESETTTAPGPGRSLIYLRSTRDKTLQPSYIIVPPNYNPSGAPVPIVVALHTWSFTLEQRHTQFETETTSRGWIYLFPNFRGVDDHAEACGSELAQQDVLDAVQWARAHYKIDEKRIYLWGWSGGGHMALQMATRQPDLWAAVSAWAGITDMAAYYREYLQEQPPTTMRQLSACMGGAPGSSAVVDTQYSSRSPITNLARASKIPIDIWNGNGDMDVSPTHALLAFNRLAEATNSAKVSDEEIAQLARRNGNLDRPQASDTVTDASLGREIFLRRTAGPSRVTIYRGSHETIAAPTFEWFEKHKKQ
jgi:dipeptidyl aminopeptidase/acylaminoacyl peptidase